MNRKIQNNKIISIKILMVISQLLLTGFVIFWLLEQYKQEENSLRKELTFQFANSQNEVIDSLLQVFVINPILHENVEMNLTQTSDSIQIQTFNTTTNTVVHIDDDGSSEKTIIRINGKDTLTEKIIQINEDQFHSEKILTKSFFVGF